MLYKSKPATSGANSWNILKITLCIMAFPIIIIPFTIYSLYQKLSAPYRQYQGAKTAALFQQEKEKLESPKPTKAVAPQQ